MSVLETTAKSVRFYITQYITGLVVGNSSSNSITSSQNLETLIYFMGESFHALPIARNAISNAILRWAVNSSNNQSFDHVSVTLITLKLDRFFLFINLNLLYLHTI